MNRERILRQALWCAAAFNLFGAWLFAFPQSPLGQLAGLPAAVPVVYRTFTALFVLLFGGAYAWLAYRRPVVKSFVAFGAIGKASAFVATALLWAIGEARLVSLGLVSGDLVFAAIFLWCLAGLETGRDLKAT